LTAKKVKAQQQVDALKAEIAALRMELAELKARAGSPRTRPPRVLRYCRYQSNRKAPVGDGLRQVTVELPNIVIEEACVRGLLSVDAKNNPWSVVQSAYSSLLSDAALDWLIRNGVIAPEQRGSCYSPWHQQLAKAGCRSSLAPEYW
jgi:hypothetical protein